MTIIYHLTLWLWSSHVERNDVLEGQLGLHDAVRRDDRVDLSECYLGTLVWV